ncbi:MAG: UDP-glucose/GDP-mannose dehydrogenase family protein [Phycisphaerae bacterium]|jgi:UDPglucose 6-dehydrogenase
MRIGVVGSGWVGLVTGTCLSDSGNHVIAVDSDARRVAQLSAGHCPFFEPGLAELLTDNLRAGRLSFSGEVAQCVRGAHVVFIAVGTPPRPDGSADLSAVESVAGEIADALSGPAVVVVKSTVPVGTGARLETLIRARTAHVCHVVSNPEFLKEGNAVDDFQRPDRVVIGAEDVAAGDLVAELYQPFVRNYKPILRMSRAAAELTKYAANAYLSTRISFINEIADICARCGVNVDEVRRGIGADERIGHHFMYPGVGYGGSCFPKDVQALASTAREAGGTPALLDAVHARNVSQRQALIEQIRGRLGADLHGRRLAVWGLAFKPKTDDVREAPSLTIIEALLAAGAEVAAYDPRATASARTVLGERVTFAEDAYAVLSGADALVIFTEWNEFRSPDFERMRRDLKQPLIFDGRNVYDPATMARHEWEYYSVGRPPVRPVAAGQR